MSASSFDRQKLRESAENAANKAGQTAMKGLDEINKLVQQGPAGLSLLCFGGNCAIMFAGIRGIIAVNPLENPDPRCILLDLYLIILGFVGFLLESDVAFLGKIPVIKSLTPHIQSYQEVVHEYANFLSNLRGRGLFYIFIGTLCLENGTFMTSIQFYIGCWSAFVGVLCIMFSFGMKPDVSSESMLKAKERSANLLRNQTNQGATYHPVSSEA